MWAALEKVPHLLVSWDRAAVAVDPDEAEIVGERLAAILRAS